ncbi:MAG: aminotransferase class III-fold pyridoxal phosphate-dependent enzyme, partial [Alphaproteobacteria bacterium]|nr:aminotransferase class III-fold pyridoxal phosphate-dependent enzyme [Alphaproteobacteria bacterium]
SKHFGGGLPISAVCTTADIAARAVANGYFATRSHATDPLPCATGEESLRIVVEEKIPAKAARIERRIKKAFSDMAKEFEWIGDVRGHGCLLGIELVKDRRTKTPANEETAALARFCLDRGLIFQIRGTGKALNVIRLVPPMTTAEKDIDRAMSIIRDAFKAVRQGGRATRPVARAAE